MNLTPTTLSRIMELWYGMNSCGIEDWNSCVVEGVIWIHIGIRIELNWINLNWRGWRWISIIDIDMDRCFGIGILKIYEWIDGFIGILEIRKEMTYVCVVCGHMSIFMDTCFHFYYYHLRWYCLLLLLMTIESTSTLTFLVVHVKVVHYQWWMVVDPILIIVDRFDNCIFGFCIIENVYSSFFVDLA